MTTLMLFPAIIEHTPRSDFGAEVRGEQLLVPRDLAEALARLSVKNAVQFVSYLYTFPSAIAGELGWELEDVLKARSALVTKLRGTLPDVILDPPPAPKRSYGALPPAILRGNAVKK